MQQKLIGAFVISSGILLALTAIAKLISGFGTARILHRFDPVFHISFGHLFQVAAMMELCVTVVCPFSKNRKFQTGLIALLASILLLYRFGLHWAGYQGLCPCLGTLTDALHLPPHVADIVMKVILAYMLIGSYATLFCLWRRHQKMERRIPNNGTSAVLSSEIRAGD